MTRTLNRRSEISEVLRELDEGAVNKRSRSEIADHVGVTLAELERVERLYRGLTGDQLEHLLHLEEEVDMLRDEVLRLEDAAEQNDSRGLT